MILFHSLCIWPGGWRGCPYDFFPEPQSVICQLNIIQVNRPQMYLCQRSEGEAEEVDFSGAGQFFSGRFADGAGELGAPNATDTFCLQGDGAGHLRINAKLRTVPGGRVSGDDQRIILLIPGKEARCAPRSPLADGGDAQQVMAPEQRSYSFV